jgi:putative holliday junction resolvase
MMDVESRPRFCYSLSIMRILGVDPGERRIGLASSDSETKIASPLSSVDARNMEQALARIASLCEQLAVEQIVVGLPLRLDGSEGEAARRARRFADKLKARTGLAVVMWDERLTSRAAGRVLGEAGVRGSKRRQSVDPIAAALILQGYLDAGSSGEAPEP